MRGNKEDIRSLEEVEREAIERALDLCEGNKVEAAGRLGIHLRTLQRKLRNWFFSDTKNSHYGGKKPYCDHDK